jgi:amino acid adenylation domain-containing protein
LIVLRAALAAVSPDQANNPSVLSDAERHTILVEWNQTTVEYPRDVLLHQLTEAQAQRTPEAVAVVAGSERLTYRELEQRANQLANRLRTLGVGPDVLVAVCAERSLEMVVALLGTLKAGGAYVPLDPEYPQDRLLLMLQDSQAPVVLTQSHLVALFQATTGAQIICLDRDWPLLAQESTTTPVVQMTAKNLAYCIYTSGSTGKPKGVLNVHEGIINRLLWMRDQYNVTAADRILQKTPYSFDVSVPEFFLPLVTGATLVMARPGGHKDPSYLVEVIRDERITTVHFVPSMLALFLETGRLEQCSSVRQVFTSGEALSFELQSRFFKHFHAKLHNLYGPTEAAVEVTYWDCNPNYDKPIVPIGRPVANTQIYVLDEQLQPTPIGVPGELHIGGVQVARGYLNRPELTAEKFIPDPFSRDPEARLYKTGDLARFLPDGNIEYLGRIDNQVKLRGFRIELGEIEAVLCECPGVQLAAVTVREDVPGDKRLVAYLVRTPGREFSLDDVRSHLKAKLPEYMIPSRFVALKEMPLTTSGKADRKVLPKPSEHEPAQTAQARTELESKILAIFARILGVKSVGVTDDFFELGGHSLLAVRLLAEIHVLTGKQIPLSAMVRAPTVERLAELVSGQSAVSSASFATLMHAGEEGRLPLFAVVIPGIETLGYAALGRYLEAQPFYTLQAQRPTPVILPFVGAELEALASEYVSELLSVQPSGPYCFVAMCDDVVLAQEMLLQLESAGREVGFFAILDTWVLENSMVPWKQRLRYYAQRLRELGQIPVRGRSKAIGQILRRKIGADPQIRESVASADRPTWNQSYWPGPQFKQPKFQAPVVMLRRPHQPYYYVKDLQMGWGQRSSGGVELHNIDLDHDNLLREPHIKTIGKILSNRLRQVESASRSPGTTLVPEQPAAR